MATEEMLSEARAWVAEHIAPHANRWDREELVPESCIQALAEKGWLGATIPEAYGGLGVSQRDYGRLTEVLGAACSSVRSLLTVHLSLTAETLLKWGTPEQKELWLPKLARGEKIAAFGLSEPETGSDAKNVRTQYREEDGEYVLNGVKKWITFGQRADVFVICANNEKGMTAFLVNSQHPGVTVKPLKGIMGTRASLLAEIHLNECRVAADAILGRKGLGFLQIVNTALDNGRYSVACGSTGIARAALQASIAHANRREQFGALLKEHQLIRQKITKMTAWTRSAQLLCRQAGEMRDAGDPDAIIQTSMAKYVASTNARMAANEAMQLHGAVAFEETHDVQRLYRDCKVMEIIEGSSEMQELLIAEYACRNINALID